MIFDLIFAFIIGAFLAYSDSNSSPPLPPDMTASPTLPADLTDLAVGQLACLRAPDPTPVLRALMEQGLIRADDREDFESYSCFEIRGGMWLASLHVNSVCGGVTDAQINAANPELYPSNEAIGDERRYQVIAFGSNQDLHSMARWRESMFGAILDEHFTPAEREMFGVIDGLYTPAISENEVYCDSALAREIGLAGAETVVPDTMPPPALVPLEPPPPPQ